VSSVAKSEISIAAAINHCRDKAEKIAAINNIPMIKIASRSIVFQIPKGLVLAEGRNSIL